MEPHLLDARRAWARAGVARRIAPPFRNEDVLATESAILAI